MNHWQRNFAYITGSIVIGLLLIVISNSYIEYAGQPGTTGYLVLIAFGLVYLNLAFGISRRFVIKAIDQNWVCYLMSFLVIAPTLLWVFTKNMGLGEAGRIYFVGTAIFAALLGTYYGIRRGIIKRAKYIQQLNEKEKRDLPDDLKRPHNDVSQN